MALIKVKGGIDQVYKNVVTMKATSANLGDYVKTLGYYSAGDGGDAEYHIVSSSDYSGTPDEIGDHSLLDGRVAVLQTAGRASVKKFGAKGDGTTDDAAAITAADAAGPIYVEDGTYLISSNITLNNKVEFSPDGSLKTGTGVTVTLGGNNDFADVRWFGATGSASIPDQSKEIQDALNSGTPEVIIPAGTYKIQTPLSVASDTKISLAKSATIQRNASIDHLIANNADGVAGGYSANNNIEIQGGTFDGNLSDFPGVDVACIVFGHTTSVVMRNIGFKDFHGTGAVVLGGSRNNIIESCFFNEGDMTDSETAGIRVVHTASGDFPYFGPYDNTQCENVTIINNQFASITNGITLPSINSTAYHSNVVISRNWFDIMDRYGIESVNPLFIKIADNTINRCATGVHMTATFSATPRGVLIVDNDFHRMIETGATDKNAIRIVGYSSITKSINDVRIANNTIDNTTQEGAYIRNCTKVTLEGNIATDCGLSGIDLAACQYFSLSDNIAKDNNTTSTASVYDFEVGNNGASTTNDGVLTGNFAGTGAISFCTRVLGRNNTYQTSLTTASLTSSSVGDNLVAGVLS